VEQCSEPVCLQGKNPVATEGKAAREPPLMSVDQEENYIPSVDLLTAQVTQAGSQWLTPV